MSETRVLADFLKNTEPSKTTGKEESRNFFSKLLSPKKKKNHQNVATPQKGDMFTQNDELRSPIREPGHFSSFDHIRPQSAGKKKKRKTLLPDQMAGNYDAPSPNMPLMSPMNESSRSHSPEEEDIRRPVPQQNLNGVSYANDMLPTPPNASPAAPRPISKQASLMPPELNLEDSRQKPETGNLLKSSGQNKSAARSKYRKSKFPEQMLAQMSLDGEDQEVPERQMPQEAEETKQFHFIDDDLLRAINNLGTVGDDSTEISSRPILTNEFDIAPIDLPLSKEKGRRQRTPQKLRQGEQLVQELNLEKSLIVNGGAIKKNYSEKKNVKFSGYDQIIPNIPPEEFMRMIQMESNQRGEIFYQQSRSQTRTPSPTPDGKVPPRSSSNRTRQQQQQQQSLQQQMYQPQPRRNEEMQIRHAPSIPSPLKQQSSPMKQHSPLNQSLESKALPLAPEPSLPIAMFSNTFCLNIIRLLCLTSHNSHRYTYCINYVDVDLHFSESIATIVTCTSCALLCVTLYRISVID